MEKHKQAKKTERVPWALRIIAATGKLGLTKTAALIEN